MHTICISGSNTKLMGSNSASTKICRIIKNIINNQVGNSESVEILPLLDYDLKPCGLCGNCRNDLKCTAGDEFNRLFESIVMSDIMFFVIPHYSPIPSKIIILFEKINEVLYSSYLNDNNFKNPLDGKTAGIIGHGGMSESKKVLDYYHNALVTPVASTLKSFSINVTAFDDTYTNGIVFGLKNNNCFVENKNSIFPDIMHDWDQIKKRIEPFVLKVLKEAKDKYNRA